MTNKDITTTDQALLQLLMRQAALEQRLADLKQELITLQHDLKEYNRTVRWDKETIVLVNNGL